MPRPKKNNESMQNAAERLIADIANNPSVYMEGDSMDKLKFLLDGMSRGRVMADGSQRASDKVATIIKEYGAPSYHREVGMTPRTVGSINRGQVAQVDPDLGVTMDYPYMSQERQRLEDVKADEMNAILADLVRNPPRRTAGTSYKTGGKVKYRSGGMMEYEQGGEVSREPKVDIIDNKVLVGGSMIKKQKPGGGFEYVPKPEYANEAMFYVDGVPATFADAKFAYEQTSDAGVGLDFNDYIEKYTKQRGAYDLDLKKQRESLGERAEAAGTPALLRALRDMR